MFKKTLTSLILTLVAFGGFFGVSIHHDAEKIIVSGMSETHAACADGTQVGPCPEDAKGNPTADAEMRKMYDAIVGGLNIILSLLTIIVAPAVMLASWLISPDWTSGDLFGIRPVMHDLWVVISNITYFIYAILLIVIALATIFNSQNYGYKAMLPKLALGIILVPLTWWAVQFTISLATYITAAVITIPQETMFKLNESKCQGESEKCWENRATIPKNIVFYNVSNSLTSEQKKENEEGSQDSATGKNCNKEICYTPRQFLTNVSGTYGHLLVYAYSVFKISDVKVLPTGVDHIKSILEIIHQGFIGAIMFLVFGILVLALTFMLMMRAIKLWFYAIFSPIFTLHFVLGDGVFGDNKESFSIKEFLGLAFVPAVVGLALSFGLVIIGSLQSSDPNNSGQPCDAAKIQTTEGCQILGMMGNDNNKIIRRMPTLSQDDGPITINEIIIGGVTFTFIGNPGSPSDIAKETEGMSGVLSATGGIIGKIIIDIIALVFIWVAFMAAKGVSKAVSAAVEPFEAMGKKIGDLGMKLPQYTPIPGTGGVSIAGANKIVQSAASDFETRSGEKAYDSPLAKAFGVDKDTKAVLSEQAKLKQALNDSSKIGDGTLVELQKAQQKIIAAHGLSSAQGKQALLDYAEILKKNGKITDTADLVDSAGNISSKGLYVYRGEINSGIKEISVNSAEKELLKNKNPNFNSNSGATATNNTINISLHPDGKGFNVGTISINESLDADTEKLAKVIKGSKLKSNLTKEEFEATFKNTTQYRNPDNLKKLVTAVGDDFFKKSDSKEESKKDEV